MDLAQIFAILKFKLFNHKRINIYHKLYAQFFNEPDVQAALAKVKIDSLKENRSRRNALIAIMVAYPVVMDCIRTNHASVFEYISKCVVLNPKGLKLYKVFYPRSDKTLYTFFLENNALKDPVYTETLYQTLGECHDFDINVFMKELVSQIPAYNAFHTADVYMSSFIDHLCDMSVEAIQEILRIYNRNSQCTNRGRHATDIATVNKYLEDQCSADDE